MSNTQIETLITLPDGVRHYCTTGSALTWDVWDTLLEADGWVERSWYCEPDSSSRCDADVPGARLHHEKKRGEVYVFPPSKPRG